MTSAHVVQLVPFLFLVVGLTRCTASSIVRHDFDDLVPIYHGVCGAALSTELHFNATSSKPGYEPPKALFNHGLVGWRPQVSSTNQWLQADLPSMVNVTGVLTQGSRDYDYYVTQYKVEHSKNGEHWFCVLDMHSQPKIFEGNTDNFTPKINKFRPAVLASFIRIKPVVWYGEISLRLEVFSGGCPECWAK